MNNNRSKQAGQANQDLVLSVRGANIARSVGANSIAELVVFTDEELLETRCFGETFLREVKEKLAQRGLRLGMTQAEVLGRPEAQGRIVTENKNANEKTHEDEHDGPCCGHCAAAARKLRERSAGGQSESGHSGRLTVARRQEIFQTLVSIQDRREMTVSESVRHVARKYQIGVSQVWQIEEEGIDKQWPPLG